MLCFTHGEASTLHAAPGDLGTAFTGRDDNELDIAVTVDRTRQFGVIRRHQSQSTDNPVLWLRLDLLGATCKRYAHEAP